MMSRKQLIRLLLYGIVGHCSIIVHKTILQTNDRQIIICSTNDLVWSNNFPIANQSMPNHTSDHCLIIANLSVHDFSNLKNDHRLFFFIILFEKAVFSSFLSSLACNKQENSKCYNTILS